MAATASNTFSDDSSNLALRVEEEPAGLFDYRRNALSETIITTIVALLVLVLVYSLLSEDGSIFVTSIALAGLVTVAFATIRYTLSPDRLRAVQTKSTLSLARAPWSTCAAAFLVRTARRCAAFCCPRPRPWR